MGAPPSGGGNDFARAMNLFGKNLDTQVGIIAEIGQNHEGDVSKAIELVHAAAKAGADAVKFQSWTPERFIHSGDIDRLERIRRFTLDQQAHRVLAAEAEKAGITFFSTPVTEDQVPFLAEICPVLKIASGDLVFEPTIRACAASGRPTILSTGAGTVAEIDQAVRWFADEVGEDALAERLCLMHCVAAYPTPIEQANVLAVPFLRERYGLPTGYSNHVIGGEAVLAATALGACLVEVHMTDCSTGRAFRDHEMSFEPDALAALVAGVQRVKASLGQFGKEPVPAEMGVIQAIRKGIVASRALPAGTILSADDLMYARPATEFSASDLPSLIGKRLTDAVDAGGLIKRISVE